jgi:ubiquinone/menaquinone biosynthesis C-methylase UbiE
VSRVAVDFDELKQRTRKAWSLGNYPELARLIEPAAREVVDACAVSPGQEVLDVAAGNGNAAVAAAREGAAVVACDLVPAMVELGRERSEREGLDIDWVEGDAEDLPFEGGRFDCVLSVFGAMLSPRPDRSASELFRVARPGGTVGMANWTPEGFQGRCFAIGNRHAALPEGVPPSSEWGRPDVVVERFGGLAARIDTELRTVRFEFESPEAMYEWFETNAGPARAARKALPPETYEAMKSETMDLVREMNTATDGSLAIDAEYLVVVARKPG